MITPLIASALLASQLVIPPPSFKVERIALYVTAAADVITTRAAIRNGAHEGNGVLAKIIGRKPSALQLIGVKVASIAIIETIARLLRKVDKHDQAKFNFQVTAFVWGYASGLNMRYAWK